jgi:hypothetical protein
VLVGEVHDLPEGFAAGEVERGEGVGFGQLLEGFAAEAGELVELVDGGEVADGAVGFDEGVGGGVGEAFDEAEAEAERGRVPVIRPPP